MARQARQAGDAKGRMGPYATGRLRWAREAPPGRSTSEPAAKEMTTRGRLYRQQRLEYRQRHGHLTRSRPQDSPSNAGHRCQEPRKPLGGRDMTQSQREAGTHVSLVSI